MKKLLYILLFVSFQGFSFTTTPVCIDTLAENYFSYLDPNDAAWDNGFFNPLSPNQYDMYEVIARLVDGSEFYEFKKHASKIQRIFDHCLFQ